MKRSLFLFFLLWLCAPVLLAQTTTFTSQDGILTFEYPATWHALDEGIGLIAVASRADLLGIEAITAGEISLFLLYEASEFGREVFADIDTTRPLEELAPEVLAFFSGDERVAARTVNGQTFYSSAPDAPEGLYYLTRTEAGGLVVALIFQGRDDDSTVDALFVSLHGIADEVETSTSAPDGDDFLAGFPAVSGRNAPTPTTCDALQLAQSSSLPLREIELRAFPPALAADDANARAFFRLPDGNTREVLLTYYDELDVVTVNIPLMEQDPYNPVSVTLHVEDYNGAPLCPVLTLDILGLPRATNTLQDTVNAVGQMLAQQRVALGIRLEDLRPESTMRLSVQQMALAWAQYAYDDPNNPNALVRLADGSAPILAQEDVDPDLLSNILASTLLSEFVLEQAQRGLTVADWRDPSQHVASTRLFFAQSAFDSALKKDIPDFKTLAKYMAQQYNAQHSIANPESYTGRVYNDMALANSLGSRVTGIYGVVIGAVMYTAKLVYEADLNLLPHKITEVNLEYDGDIDFEDDETTYNYRNMRVTAESRGWNVKYTLIDGTLMLSGQFLPIKNERAIVTSAEKTLKFSQNPQALAAAEQALTRSKPIVDAYENAQVAGEVASNLISRTDTGGTAIDDVLTIAPFVWKDIPVEYDDIRDVVVNASPTQATPAVKITNPARGEYRALNAGVSLLRFELNVENQVIFLTKPIRVRKISLLWNASGTIVLKEGEQYCFEVTVSFAQDTRTRLNVSSARFNFSQDYSQDAFAYCFVSVPIEQQWTQPLFCDTESVLMPEFYTVEIVSLADRGARDPNWNPSWEERRLVVVVRVEPNEETLRTAQKPDNPNCTAFAGDWQFTSIPEDSFFCVPYDIPRVTSSVNLSSAGGGRNLLDADVIIVTGLGTEVFTLAREDRSTRAFFAEGNFTFEGLNIYVEWQLTFEDAGTAALLATSYTNIFDQLPDDAKPLVSGCRTGNITYFIVYEGIYTGGR